MKKRFILHTMKTFKLLFAIIALLTYSHQLSAQIQWKNPLDEAFTVVRGQGWENELKGTYFRLPDRAENIVRTPIWKLSRHSAGLSIVFRSNAPEIKVRYTVKGGLNMAHMPSTGVSGVDMYATDMNGHKRWCAGKYAFKDTITYTYSRLSYATSPSKGYEYQLFLPTYNTVTWLEVGVPEGATLQFMPKSQEKPIVVYGSSIAQGACSSRPGMAWPAIIDRVLEHPVINLGFSGNGQQEAETYNFLAEIDAKLFIIDCMPNMNLDRIIYIYERTLNGVRKLREKTDAPILLVEHSGYVNEQTSLEAEADYRKTNVELRKAYRTLLQEGVKGLYYLTHEEIGLTEDSMVEGVHPSDLGMQQYADAYIKKLKEILQEDCEERTVFKPCTQQRDPYNWKERHEQILALNKEKAPQIVLIGNSITHFWAGEPAYLIAKGTDSWEKLFRGKEVRNMGFGYDRIENALWRIYHGELDGYQAQKIVLLMGTNNLDKNTDDEIVAGINELIRAVRHRQPTASIYVAGILPRAGRESRISILNQTLQARLLADEATYIDLSGELIQPNGKIINELFSDGLHPNKEGYQRLAHMLEKIINE